MPPEKLLKNEKMQSIGIDTNILLEFRLKRQPGFEIAQKCFKQCIDGKINIYIPLPCILETEWVLRSFYKQPKEEIINFFEELFLVNNLDTDNKENTSFSINLYKQSREVSFTDCIIIKQIQSRDANFVTFDNNLSKLYKSLR